MLKKKCAYYFDWAKKILSTLQKKISVFSSIYDLYFLNNNKYLKSFEDKSLSKIYGEPCTKFSKLIFLVIQNFFTDTSKKNLHKNRKFQWPINNSKKFLNYNHKKKIDLVEIWFCVKIAVLPIFTFTSETTPILCCTQTQKKTKKKTHIIVKSIHSSLRSESKTIILCQQNKFEKRPCMQVCTNGSLDFRV
ncbi:hypothetical protein AGLY_008734 [Aphis glycines]|uniref:Uncharacterized protein n=1 Tax=Aphis glycines TaxID=307491 RepID=A0A6G0TK07_APHGL|nr:hypothetical protein AGLY_008734 [Aphis glycines]